MTVELKKKIQKPNTMYIIHVGMSDELGGMCAVLC